jgi:WD40 repeat protein
VRFSPDGRTLAVATAQGNRSRLYAIDVGSRRSRLLGTWPEIVTPPPWSTTTIAFSPDGAEIAMGLGDSPPTAPLTTAERLVLVNAATGRVVWQRKYPMLPGQGSQYVAFAPNGVLVTSADGGTTDLWDPRRGRIIRQFPTGGRLAMAPNGRVAAIGVIGAPGQSGSLQLLNLMSGATRTLQAIPDPTWITTLAFTPDGKTLVGGALDHNVRVWDTATGSIVQTFQSESGGRIQVEIDPSGRTVLSSADDGSVTAWDLSGIQVLGRTFGWSTPDNCCSFAAINPAGTFMAADMYDGTVALIDLRTLHLYASLPVIKAGLVAQGLAFTPDGRQLVTGDQGGKVIFWDVRTRAAVRRLRVADPVTWLAVSPDQRLLAVQTQASSGSIAHVQVLDVATGSLLHTYAVPGSGGEGRDGQGGVGVDFSFDGRELAAVGCCSPASSIQVWDAASGRLLFSPHITERESSIAFSPTSGLLAAGTSDGKILLWDARRGTPVRAPIQLAASNVHAIAFGPDGRQLVASLQSGDTLLLDLASGQRVGTSFPDMPGTITGPLFSPQGDVVVVYDGVAADWPTDMRFWVRYACQVAGRDMTPTEWANVLPNRPYRHVCPQ